MTQRIIPIAGKDVLCELVHERHGCKDCLVNENSLAGALCEPCTDTIWRPVGEKPPVAPEQVDAVLTEARRADRERIMLLEDSCANRVADCDALRARVVELEGELDMQKKLSEMLENECLRLRGEQP